MREIEFRGKPTLDEGFVYGDLEVRRKDGSCFIHCYAEDGAYSHQVQVMPETVGQYTGWKPRKCNKLYEGDIIGFDDWAFTERQRKKMKHRVGVIKWSTDDGRWQVHCEDGIYLGNDVADPQLLGNIYDNPELVKDV